MKKRILALLLAVVMIVGVLPASVLAAESGTPEFSKVNMTLNGVLNVNFKLEDNGADMSNYSVRVTIGNDTKYQDIKNYTPEGSLYVYTAYLVAHRMNETLTVELMNGDTVVTTKTFKVSDYVAEVEENYPNDTELHNMMDAMVNYGAYAAYYANPNGTAPGVTAVEDVTKDDVSRYQFNLIQAPTTVTPVVSLYLARACDLRIRFDADSFDGHTLYIDGEQVELETLDGTLMYTIPELIPQNWDKAYNIKVLNSAGDTAFEAEYSVLSYVYNQLRKTTEARTGLNNLLKAMYLYYDAVEEYISKNGVHDSVVTPNADRVLYSNGASAGYIFMFDIENADVKQAVDFINTQFNELAGSKISYPGTTDSVNWDESKKYIVVGNHTMFANAGLTMPVDDLGETGYYIVTKGNSVFIMADEDADEAQAYQLAALAFLKAVTGYEMYAADCVSFTVADGKNFTLPDMSIIEKPDIDYRNRGDYKSVAGGTYGMGYTNNNIFMSVNDNVYHTALDLLDPSTYYSSHKDWFFLESQNSSVWDQIIGATRYDHYQLCYSTILNSEEALGIMYDNLKQVVLDNPTLDNVSLGVADNDYICDCSNCNADGVGNYVRVANKLAEMMVEDPEIDRDVKLVIFAYRQYKTAPTSGVVAHRNVGVMVAPIEASFNTPIADQSEYADIIKAWAKLTDHLYLWFYQTNFDYFMYPMDSWTTMQDNLKFAREVGADYIFYQGQGKNEAVSHFSMLKNYLESQWLRDADADYDTLLDNFFANYYGPAAVPMRQYYDALLAHFGTISDDGTYKEAIATTANWPQATLQAFMGYINEAYAAVKTSGTANAALYNERIRLESLFPRFALLSLYSDTTTAGTANNFAMDCDTAGVTYYNEGTLMSACDYSGWWNHTCSSYSEYAHDRCLVSGATEQSAAIYYKTCSACGAINYEETFTNGLPLDHDTHTYEFVAGTDDDAGYDVGTCFCGETVKVKTDYTDSTPTDIINGTAATLTMPENFEGTVTGGSFGSTLTFTGTTFDTTSIQAASHGLWTIEVNFTSEYGGTHTAKVPVTLITDVIDDAAELTTFAAEAMAANNASTAMHGYYILGADIDCDGTSIATGGGGWNQGFYGTFDGRGHKIQNLLVNNQGGIFGRLAGTVKDVHFADVSFNANTALFAKVTDGATFTNVTVDIASWVSVSSNMTYAGILGVSQNLNNKFSNFVVNVAPGVSVSCLMGAKFSGTGDITVNLPNNAAIVNYYTDASGNNVTSADGTIITVNTIAYNNYEVDTAYTGEQVGTLTLTNDGFTDGASASVSVNGGTPQTVTVSGTSITFSLSDAAAGQNNAVVIAIGTNTWTYTNVFAVTQIIDTVDEMNAFINISAGADYSGYYVLGADINMNGAEVGAVEGWYAGFTGTFDGCGYTVSNFKVNTRGGIFGALKGATVKNVTFDNVGYLYATATYGAALLGRTGSGNTTVSNVTVNITSWHNGGNVNGGALFASKTEDVTFTNVSVSLADNLSITTRLFGYGFDASKATGSITVYMGTGSSVSCWYKSSADVEVTELPTDSIITVIKAYEPVEKTIDTETIIEDSTMPATGMTDGTVTVTLGGTNYTGTVADGVLTITGLPTATGKQTENVVITYENGDTYTYTNIWHVTQVINDADELRNLGLSCQAGYVDGYIILGNDIDCSSYATMNVDPGWTSDNGLTGTFDGRGYAISNIKIVWTSSAATENGVGGLFSRLYGATVKNTVFNVSNLGGNGSLLARFAVKSDTSDVILENLTVNLSAYASNAEAVFIGYSMYNTQFNGVTLNVADGVTIGNLFTKNGYNGNSGTDLTVKLGTGSSITYYYGNSADNAKPDFVTVIEADATRTPTVEEVDTLVAGEASTNVTFAHDVFADCTSATVTINGHTENNVSISNGQITVDLADYGVSSMGQIADGAVITTNLGDEITYTEVWYVTQVIDDATELKALGTLCKDNVVTGYYILGGDIDCSAEATMSNGSASSTTNGFSGTFNGRGLKISNIKMTWDSATSGLGGLFGKLLGCTIQDTVFDNVNLGTNGTLLASGADKNSSTSVNTTLKNLTINLTGYSTVYGAVVGYSMFNTVGSGLTINVADGLTIAALLARDSCNSIAYIYATVNLGTGSTITTYYSGATTAPTTFTVNEADAQAAAITVSSAPVAMVTKALRNIFANLDK